MLHKLATLSLVLAAAASVAFAQAKPIPQLVKKGAKYSLLVDGRPFLMLGGQVDNRVFVPEEMAKVLPGFQAYHANTVEFPVPWKLIEPKEGQFEFTAVDQIVRDIRAHGLRAIPLWFGTWKGDETTYLPDWITSNPKRFPKALDADGKASKSLSPHGAATLEADRKAFGALLKNLREIDGNDRTVILVQVENEPGIVGPGARSLRGSQQAVQRAGSGGVRGRSQEAARNLGTGLRPPVRGRGFHHLLHGPIHQFGRPGRERCLPAPHV